MFYPCQDLEERLSGQHLQNMAAQIESHKKAIESLEESARKDKVSALKDMTRQTEQNIGEKDVANLEILLLEWNGCDRDKQPYFGHICH